MFTASGTSTWTGNKSKGTSGHKRKHQSNETQQNALRAHSRRICVFQLIPSSLRSHTNLRGNLSLSCLFVCLFLCLCLFVCLSVCLFQSLALSVCLWCSVHLFVCLCPYYFSVFVCLSLCLSSVILHLFFSASCCNSISPFISPTLSQRESLPPFFCPLFSLSLSSLFSVFLSLSLFHRQ